MNADVDMKIAMMSMNPACKHEGFETDNICYHCAAVRGPGGAWRPLTDIERKRNIVVSQTAITLFKELGRLSEAEQVGVLSEEINCSIQTGYGAEFRLVIKREDRQ